MLAMVVSAGMPVPVTIIPTRSPSALIAETVVEALVVAFVRCVVVRTGAWNVRTTLPPASVIVAPLSAMAAAGIEMPSVSSSPG